MQSVTEFRIMDAIRSFQKPVNFSLFLLVNHRLAIGDLFYVMRSGELTEATQALKAIAVDVDEGKLVVLTCWCKPEACHGDVIVSCINWIIQEGMV